MQPLLASLRDVRQLPTLVALPLGPGGVTRFNSSPLIHPGPKTAQVLALQEFPRKGSPAPQRADELHAKLQVTAPSRSSLRWDSSRQFGTRVDYCNSANYAAAPAVLELS